MAEKIKIEIVTPEAMVVSEEVDEITIAGSEGEFGVLPGHCHMLSMLKVGEVSYRSGSAVTYMAIGGGYAQVGPERVTVLAETAELARDIDAERARAALSRAEGELKGLALDDGRYAEAEAAAERARTRIEVAAR